MALGVRKSDLPIAGPAATPQPPLRAAPRRPEAESGCRGGRGRRQRPAGRGGASGRPRRQVSRRFPPPGGRKRGRGRRRRLRTRGAARRGDLQRRARHHVGSGGRCRGLLGLGRAAAMVGQPAVGAGAPRVWRSPVGGPRGAGRGPPSSGHPGPRDGWSPGSGSESGRPRSPPAEDELLIRPGGAPAPCLQRASCRLRPQSGGGETRPAPGHGDGIPDALDASGNAPGPSRPQRPVRSGDTLQGPLHSPRTSR